MKSELTKFAQAAGFVLALALNAFADESAGNQGFRFGFTAAGLGQSGSVGAIFDLGNNLELGLGIGLSFDNTTAETNAGNNTTTVKRGNSSWEIIPSGSYAFSRGDIFSWGAGLEIHLASWAKTSTVSGTTTTQEPEGIDLALFPNFFIKAELVKNFALGLKPGFFIYMPGDEETGNTKTSRTVINLGTEFFISFYL